MRLAELVRYSSGGLRGHRLRTALSLLGVMIGVTSVIILTSLGEGARLYVTGEFASLGSNLLIIVPGKTETAGATPFVSTAPNDLTVDDARALARQIPEIRLVSPISLGTAPVEFGDRARDCPVIGTTHEVLEIRKLEMQVGRFLPADTAGGDGAGGRFPIPRDRRARSPGNLDRSGHG
jgi:putative ABC transport system permease protein